jgi:hypothetical protein
MSEGSGTAVTPANGTMISYAITYDGAVWCGENPPAGTFKAKAKIYCD